MTGDPSPHDKEALETLKQIDNWLKKTSFSTHRRLSSPLTLEIGHALPERHPSMRTLEVLWGPEDASEIIVWLIDADRRSTKVDLTEEQTWRKTLTLDFPDNAFDVVEMHCANGSVSDIDTCLGEAFRVLKPGGRFVSLDAAQPDIALVRMGFSLWWKVHKDRPYSYLSHSPDRRPDARALAAAVRRTGFTHQHMKLLNLGTWSLTWGDKPTAE